MRELTLILATTPKMGIGLAGTLPWPSLKKEMAYFARVTKRLVPPSQSAQQNAVIMGRKTWDSIPPRFRPLPNRLNIVISRSINTIEKREDQSLWAGSLEKALQWVDEEEGDKVGRVFVIGGAEIYKAALGLKEARRVLLTRVEREWECDAFFPLELTEREEGWRRVGQEEMDGWVGEEVPKGRQVEKEGTGEETGYEFEMWERVGERVG
ncbi:dihydrofolate reductase-like domain-containing protein [Triangularia setosa]|uniref:Dihydrofolate reductase n=1 Tax=Triangularia setosa TaxID=2587417 RepID=A0AAN6W5C9_9PEZI|nr:dihydrofolate reductase-like domain-containing protein [Podospora setosa]